MTSTPIAWRDYMNRRMLAILVFGPLALGGLGLLLGTTGMIAVIFRSALERRGELALMSAAGFARSRDTNQGLPQALVWTADLSL